MPSSSTRSCRTGRVILRDLDASEQRELPPRRGCRLRPLGLADQPVARSRITLHGDQAEEQDTGGTDSPQIVAQEADRPLDPASSRSAMSGAIQSPPEAASRGRPRSPPRPAPPAARPSRARRPSRPARAARRSPGRRPRPSRGRRAAPAARIGPRSVTMGIRSMTARASVEVPGEEEDLGSSPAGLRLFGVAFEPPTHLRQRVWYRGSDRASHRFICWIAHDRVALPRSADRRGMVT